MASTILLTRPAPQSLAYAQTLEDMFRDRIRCVTSPLLEIAPTGAAPKLDGVQAVLFTSANGVRTLSKLNTIKPAIPCFCVGDKTAMEARGLGCEAFSAKGGADELVQLASTILTPAGGPILYIRGKMATGDIAQKLTSQGFSVDEHIIYEQVPLTLTDLARDLFEKEKIDILPLFSPMTAKLLADEITNHPEWRLDNIDAICLSANVRNQVNGLAFRSLSTVETPTADAMSSAIAGLLRQ